MTAINAGNSGIVERENGYVFHGAELQGNKISEIACRKCRVRMTLLTVGSGKKRTNFVVNLQNKKNEKY
jgi:hypothetical protein